MNPLLSGPLISFLQIRWLWQGIQVFAQLQPHVGHSIIHPVIPCKNLLIMETNTSSIVFVSLLLVHMCGRKTEVINTIERNHCRYNYSCYRMDTSPIIDWMCQMWNSNKVIKNDLLWKLVRNKDFIKFDMKYWEIICQMRIISLLHFLASLKD